MYDQRIALRENSIRLAIMVVAEVPLWVIHNNNNNNSNSGGTHTTTPTPAAADHLLTTARHSLNFLLPGSSSSSRNSRDTTTAARSHKKCAVYGIDVHPQGHIFATAGGDGTVRLWNVAALFPTAAAADGGAARFDQTTGAYVSSESSSSNSSGGEGHSGTSDDDDHDDKGDHTMNGNNPKQPAVATEESSLSSSSEAPAVPVHDLNAVVRRKKDGSAAARSSSLPRNNSVAPAVTTAPSLSAGVKSSHHSHNGEGHHHHHHQHRLLCTLSAHTGSSVLAVRFSTGGQYLASAGDDACVCVYAPSKTATAGNLTSSSDKAAVEHFWSRIKLCRGHGLDVVDLAWAPDDSHLVSCSLDSATPIIVWKLTDLGNNNKSSSNSMICNPFRVLGQSVHTSTVKGVAFDPAGSYLASSGDDPAVCIWRAHDDWGLEKKIDAQSGIFRTWSASSSARDDDVQALSSQSLFRRISWSTDGAFVCSTNSVVKNKHVVSTISREGWSVSGGGGGAEQQSAGAANLVGHKQPVVVSRHSTQLLNARKHRKPKSGENSSKSSKEDDDDLDEKYDENEENEPEYATLLALGDRRGFVTVWSTRKSRPIFKLQCSESHCTVTDLSWGVLGNGDLMLLVSLLDGQVVALRFAVPDELGTILSQKEKARVFQLRYGIDIDGGDDAHGGGGIRRGHLFVGGYSGPKLIENALQMTLEESRKIDDEASIEGDMDADSMSNVNELVSYSVKGQQQESRSHGGKKRIRPVLLQVSDTSQDKRPKSTGARSQLGQTQVATPADPLQNAMDAAEKVVAAAESGSVTRDANLTTTQQVDASGAPTGESGTSTETARTPARNHHRHAALSPSAVSFTAGIPHSTERIHCADLPTLEGYVLDAPVEKNDKTLLSAECVNVSKVPVGSKGGSIPIVDISISYGGSVSWKDQIMGTSCSAVAASRYLLAIGTADGSIQFFGSSPTLGWSCGSGFRSHPPLILGHPIVALQLKEVKRKNEATLNCLDMLVVTSDGAFGLWSVLPELRLQYKGSILPAMTHMSLGRSSAEERRLPKLSRIQITDLGRLFLLLSFDSSSTNRQTSADRAVTRLAAPNGGGPGGSLQAFVYNRNAELWLRVSDSRFVLSDFYSALPSSKLGSRGVLSRMDDAVRIGSLQSSLKASQRGRLGDRYADGIYEQIGEDTGNYIASRSHCEDRMACALAMESSSEFKHWLLLYVRSLVMRGMLSHIRMLVDMLLGRIREGSTEDAVDHGACWWLSIAPTILDLDRRNLMKSVVIPEMSKNRALQRITNEISLEIDSI